MSQIRQIITRRRLLAGAGFAATLIALPPPSCAQDTGNAAPAGASVLRARRVGLGAPDGASAEIWAYEGAVPGPPLRAMRGQEIRVRLVNELGEPTALHFRGVRLANAMDGVPRLTQAPVMAGESFDYRFTMPDAGTFWYGPPPLEAAQLDRGLCGALVVAESEPVAADRDLLLVMTDQRSADGTGEVAFAVNGQSSLDVAVRTNERLRLRLVNAARTRPLSLRFDRHRATVMAIDGQPAEPFVARDGRVALGPGNRLDVFVDMALAPGEAAQALLAGPGRETPLLHFTYGTKAPVRATPLSDPAPLPANGLPARIELRNALRKDLVLDGAARQWTQGAAASSGQFGAPLFSTRRGRVIVLAVTNRTTDMAMVHLHGHTTRLLDKLDDGWKPFWLDTIMTAPEQTVRLAFLADNPGKWLVHAAIPGRQDGGLAAWFEVI